MSVMVGSVTESLVLNGNSTDTVMKQRVQLASTLSVLVGLFQVCSPKRTSGPPLLCLLALTCPGLSSEHCEDLSLPSLLLATPQVALGLVHFGFIVTYLSEPLVRGYTTAASVQVLVSQLKYVFGLTLSSRSGPLSLIYVSDGAGGEAVPRVPECWL